MNALRDEIFPRIGEVTASYTTIRVWCTFPAGSKSSGGYLTYKTRRPGKLFPGDTLNVQTPKGVRSVRIMEIHDTPQDTNPDIEYKFIEDVKVQDG